MNKQRRQTIYKAISSLEGVKERIEDVLDEEDESRENMPESLQCSDRYEESEESSENIGASIESINDAIEYLEKAIE